MTASEFERLADATLERLRQALEDSAPDCDCEPRGSGVLEIEFSDGSRIVVNRHSPAQEIWVASKSGGSHFRWSGGDWINTREGTELFSVLSGLLSDQVGTPVVLKKE